MNKLAGKKYQKNARKITEKQLNDLKRWMQEFGDLSGVILNIANNEYVGGNQRLGILQEGELIIEKRLEKPDVVGTVAYGYVLYQEQRFNYREVNWTGEQHGKASLIANKAGGIFDDELLREHFADILDETGFDQEEIDNILKEDIENLPEDEQQPNYPIVAKFSEKHSAFVIVCDDEIDENFIKQVLSVQVEQSYKNQNTANSYVISAKKFISEWNKLQS